MLLCRIPTLSESIGRDQEIQRKAEVIKRRHETPSKKVLSHLKQQGNASQSHNLISRFETDNVIRQLREVFFENWD